MKKVLVVLLVTLGFTSQAFAWGPREQGILTGVAGLWVYQQLSRPQVVVQQAPVAVQPQPVYVYPQVVYGAPTTAPVIPAPGQVCELKSEVINGQIVTGNFCYYR